MSEALGNSYIKAHSHKNKGSAADAEGLDTR